MCFYWWQDEHKQKILKNISFNVMPAEITKMLIVVCACVWVKKLSNDLSTRLSTWHSPFNTYIKSIPLHTGTCPIHCLCTHRMVAEPSRTYCLLHENVTLVPLVKSLPLCEPCAIVGGLGQVSKIINHLIIMIICVVFSLSATIRIICLQRQTCST